MPALEKPKSFYDEFVRKGTGTSTTHYCPGCGHGTVHKLIAEALDDMHLQDRGVMLSPVGCAAFAYYYFDTGNVACSHGRAPAVATGIRRTVDDAIIISYQGDGDLAGIGTAEIVHAANRGENITVFFVNNAIYGMTGGQMAPTTLMGQVTATTPLGRERRRDGFPIRMSELLATLEAPVYIERVALTDPKHVMKTRSAIRKALRCQSEGRGFSMVEILSPCPVNWKVSPVESRRWIQDYLEPVFPLGVYRDLVTSDEITEETTAGTQGVAKKRGRFDFLDAESLKSLLEVDTNSAKTAATPRASEPSADTATAREHLIKISGFGGQGIMSAGILLAECAIRDGWEATWLPSYGPEMRGGTANASVVLSKRTIGSPVVDRPTALIAMNGPSLDEFEDSVTPGGVILVNSTLIERRCKRSDVEVLYVDASAEADAEGFLKGTNIIMLTIFLLQSRFLSVEMLRTLLPEYLKKPEHLPPNLRMIERGIELFEELS
jgi:2-oxoisovalerate ferredoxin oxidoreductase beta subunit